MWSGDPERDADRYQDEQERWLMSRPVCCNCDEHIQTDKCFRVGDDVFCLDCEEAAMINAWDYARENYEEYTEEQR